MPRKLDASIAEVLKEFGFGPDACWDCHGTWVIYHRVLEQIAAKGGITFDAPLVLEANGAGKVAAICVTGRLKDKAEWSIGEAAPGNNKTAYPFAMAEKRAKDRVILKLVGLHGLAYSEDEADDFKESAPARAEAPIDSGIVRKQQDDAKRLISAFSDCRSVADVDATRRQPEFVGAFKALPEEFQKQVSSAIASKRNAVMPADNVTMAG